MSRDLVRLEFVGGPYDGHTEKVPLAVEKLTKRLALPVNENMFRILEGAPLGPKLRASSVAIYLLQQDEDEVKFQFCRSVALSEVEAEGWAV